MEGINDGKLKEIRHVLFSLLLNIPNCLISLISRYIYFWKVWFTAELVFGYSRPLADDGPGVAALLAGEVVPQSTGVRVHLWRNRILMGFFKKYISKSTYHYFRAVLPLFVVGVVVGLPLWPVGERQLASAVGPAELALLFTGKKILFISFFRTSILQHMHIFCSKLISCASCFIEIIASEKWKVF